MKRRSSILLLLFFVGMAIPGITMAQKGLKLGFVAIPQNTWLYNTDDWDAAKDDYNHKLTFGMAAGPMIGYNFGEVFGFRLNVLYSLQGQKYTRKNAQLDLVEENIRLHYLKVPFTLGFNTNTEHAKVIFSFHVGFYASLLMKAKLYDNDQSYVPDPVFFSNILDYPTDNELFESLDYGPVVDIGFDIKLTYNIMANIHLRADYSLADVENKDATITYYEQGITYRDGFYDDNRPSTANMTGGLMIGITYTFTDQ